MSVLLLFILIGFIAGFVVGAIHERRDARERSRAVYPHDIFPVGSMTTLKQLEDDMKAERETHKPCGCLRNGECIHVGRPKHKQASAHEIFKALGGKDM